MRRRMSHRGCVVGACFAAAMMIFGSVASAQSAKAPVPELTGVYEVVRNGVTLPGGLKNAGTPEEISIQPGAAEKLKTVDISPDPAKTCQPIGPFRMMAREGNKIDVLQPSGTRKIFILFEDYFLGFFRQIYLDQPHQPKGELPDRDPGQGNSVGHWEGDTLVVDTINFNQYTWLNAEGVPHSDALHLIERYRPVAGGQYLEVKVTAEDPKVLAKPYSYTRYFQKTNAEMQQYVCTDDLVTPPIPGVN